MFVYLTLWNLNIFAIFIRLEFFCLKCQKVNCRRSLGFCMPDSVHKKGMILVSLVPKFSWKPIMFLIREFNECLKRSSVFLGSSMYTINSFHSVMSKTFITSHIELKQLWILSLCYILSWVVGLTLHNIWKGSFFNSLCIHCIFSLFSDHSSRNYFKSRLFSSPWEICQDWRKCQNSRQKV